MKTVRLLRSRPADGAHNMAVDELLLEHAAGTGETVLRVYEWSSPTLSFGRNQTASGIYDPARIDEHGVSVVRRPTGGRALLHHREVTYCVAGPVGRLSLRDSYTEINGILIDALRSIGVDASTSSHGRRARSPSAVPCFFEPSAGEITVGSRKLVGSAQWRSGGGFMQHGSILLEDDQSMIPVFTGGDHGTIPAPATLSAILGRTPAADEVADAIFSAVRSRGSTNSLVEEELGRESIETVANRYRDKSWTWRR
jgi:lipoyl(octanoyl) transferase